MPLSELAGHVYAVLRQRVPAADGRIGYLELIQELPQAYATLEPDGEPLRMALAELVHACQRQRLPAIAALVVRRDRGEYVAPGRGYYPTAHPQFTDYANQMIAWANEIMAVRRTTYPAELE